MFYKNIVRRQYHKSLVVSSSTMLFRFTDAQEMSILALKIHRVELELPQSLLPGFRQICRTFLRFLPLIVSHPEKKINTELDFFIL